jgi:hypothetical protein
VRGGRGVTAGQDLPGGWARRAPGQGAPQLGGEAGRAGREQGGIADTSRSTGRSRVTTGTPAASASITAQAAR